MTDPLPILKITAKQEPQLRLGENRIYNSFVKRDIMQQLLQWKNSHRRKPLIINGARQVGKTCTLRQFGTENYPIGATGGRCSVFSLSNVNFTHS